MESPDLNASVSNEKATLPEEAALAAQDPSEGPNPGTKPANDDGSENVPGYQRVSEENATLELAEFTEALRDIGEASFGGPVLEAVIGHDDRVQITDTSSYPYRAIASLLITAADNSRWLGTGWFISARTLVTAGHCVYINNSGVPGRDGWVKSIAVIPGRNRNQMPFGSATSNQFRSVTGWTNHANENLDYGAIVIPKPLGDTVGVFGFGVYTDDDLRATMANISGYPGDKPSGTQWYHARKVTSVGPQKVFYDIDTAGGQSGAPVWRAINNARYAIAIHTYGGFAANSGTRITNSVYTNLVAWKA